MIDVRSEAMERVHLLLGGIPGATDKAFSRIINRGLTTVRSESSKRIRDAYHINQSNIKNNQQMRIRRASASDLSGEITFAGAVIPLIKFQVNPSSPQKRTVSVKVLRSEGATRLVNAYVANLGQYGIGVFERMTPQRATSQQLYGPSTAHMMQRESVLTKVSDAAQRTIDKRVEHEISAILNGYGV